MKKLIAKASKSFTLPPSSTNSSSTSPAGSGRSIPVLKHTTATGGPSLQPKYVVPAIPHPCPHDHLAVLVTKEGLLIRPHIPGENPKHPGSLSRICISWSKTINIQEIQTDNQLDLDWSENVVVYGILGVLELFSCSYVLVISSRSEIGHVLDQSHTVYGVKNVTAIPLIEDRARSTVNTLRARNAALSRPSLPGTLDTTGDVHESDLDEDTPTTGKSSGARVQFSSSDDVRLLTPQTTPYGVDDQDDLQIGTLSSQSSSSELSTASLENATPSSPVIKTLANRLSFWSRLPRRDSIPLEHEPTPILEPLSLTEEQEALEKILRESKEEPSKVIKTIIDATAPPPLTHEERDSEMEVKIVRECIKEFTKGGMYFAYTFDITRALQHKQEQMVKSQRQHKLLAGLGALPSPTSASSVSPKEGEKISPLAEPYPTLPLWRRVDKQFWWNEWLSKPFMEAGLHSYVLPVMQGYFQVTRFGIPPDPITHDEEAEVDYIVISRRSKDRAGLRYQRRGIDDTAHVANFVETEAIVRVFREEKENIFSYVQIRGSIPLYWTQTGYGLKPPPLLATDRTHEQNLDVLGRHFKKMISQYGPLTAVNLAEQQGKEGAITQGYRDYVTELNSPDAHYCEYDFHTETKGMKYENISKLINSMERTFDAQGFLWISDNTVFSQQKGVFRVNCIDCLDRTNVVQSAFARYVLNKQLGAIALLNPSAAGKPEIDLVFNDVWANNGDAISRAYAGTSALKGDFTRTGKRDLGGMLNDGVNSLARMFTSTFSDWFCQAVIDFMLGNRTLSVFSEFLLKLQSTDPRDLIRLSRIRTEAIATSVSRVLPEGERLLSGWTLFAPEGLNETMALKFEEKVLLLSSKALYIVNYDYTLEKVKVYTRVPLGDIVKISKGAYILSPLEEASRDPKQNAGFVITWNNSNQESRLSSYAVRNSLDSVPPSPSPMKTSMAVDVKAGSTKKLGPLNNTFQNINNFSSTLLQRRTSASLGKPSKGSTTFAAFKVLPIDPARVRRASSTGGGSSTFSSGGGAGGGGGHEMMYAEASDELNSAGSCKEAVDLIVDCIVSACEDAKRELEGGSGGGGEKGRGRGRAGLGVAPGNRWQVDVVDEDVVSLAEAQKTTSVYAKMEYGVKRLLWLGG